MEDKRKFLVAIQKDIGKDLTKYVFNTPEIFQDLRFPYKRDK